MASRQNYFTLSSHGKQNVTFSKAVQHLINVLQKQITVAFNLLTTLTNLNTTATLKLMKLRSCKNYLSYDMANKTN